MGLHLDQHLSIHEAALKLRTQRTEMIAANLANQNTPGYQAQDLDFRASMAAVMKENEVGSVPFSEGLDKPTFGYRVPFNPRQDGNTVEPSVEQAQFAQNAMAYQASLTLAAFWFKGVAKAISGQ